MDRPLLRIFAAGVAFFCVLLYDVTERRNTIDPLEMWPFSLNIECINGGEYGCIRLYIALVFCFCAYCAILKRYFCSYICDLCAKQFFYA